MLDLQAHPRRVRVTDVDVIEPVAGKPFRIDGDAFRGAEEDVDQRHTGD